MEVAETRCNPRPQYSIGVAESLPPVRPRPALCNIRSGSAIAAPSSMPAKRLRGCWCAQLVELLQRLGHKNCRACFLLQGIALKTGRLIHANRLMIFVHHLQCQLTTTKFLRISFDR